MEQHKQDFRAAAAPTVEETITKPVNVGGKPGHQQRI